ncbi:hypothetical protein LIER_23950 [Lithospermum erythrorhizon]|uniref:Uncharacterized protein n=1 Tax=Lithospermum erythrorhizon TaxID=34254 RepID=A0AAV3R504_LITER
MFDPGSSSVSNNKHDNLIHPYVVDPLRNSVDSHESCEPLNSYKTADDSSFRPYDDQELQFRTEHHKNNMDVDEYGSSSPTLWKSTPRNIELHSHQPSSRAQAIAKGQREMMEIVNNMPESSYELSLKDIVEHHHPIRLDDDDDKTSANQEEYLIQERHTYFDYRVQQQQHRAKKVIKRQVSVKTKMVRSGSVDNNRGLFLKMVFPLTWKQSQKKSTISSSSTALPTKHVTLTKSTNSDDGILEKSLRARSRRMGTNTIDKDWSMRRFSSESSNGMNSSSNGTNSSSSGSSNSGCSLKIRNRYRLYS